jgi:two-component system, OmpR family, response regulator
MSQLRGRILIVDDEPDVLEMLRLYLSDGRFDVMTARNGAEALTIARRHRPDAVLLDLIMPLNGMDDVQVLRALRTMDTSIAVVIVTANPNETPGRDLLTIGAFDYVSRPFDFDRLDRVMMTAVAAGAHCAAQRRAIAS